MWTERLEILAGTSRKRNNANSQRNIIFRDFQNGHNVEQRIQRRTTANNLEQI